MGFFSNSQSGMDRLRNQVAKEERDAKAAAKKDGKKIAPGKPGNRNRAEIERETIKRSGSLQVIRGK